MSVGKGVKITVSLGVSLIFIIWLYNICDWREVWKNLWQVNYWYFIPASVILFLQFVLRSARWYFLLPKKPEQQILGRDLYDSIMLGNLASYILPLRAGEFIRPLILARRADLSYAATFVTVVIERFFDLAVVLASFALILPFLTDLPGWVMQGAYGLNLLAIIILALILASIFLPEILIRVVTWTLQFFPRKIAGSVLKIVRDMIEGSAELKDYKNLLIVSSLSVAVWITTFIQYYFYLLIFPDMASVYTAITISIIIALAVAAPSAPGFIGVYEGACLFVLVELFAKQKESAAVYGLLSHLHHYVFIGVFGILAMLRLGIKFKDFKSKNVLNSERSVEQV